MALMMVIAFLVMKVTKIINDDDEYDDKNNKLNLNIKELLI